MTTNIIAIVALTLITNVTNSTFEMPLENAYLPSRGSPVNVPRRETQRILNGRTNSATVDRTVYSATQVLRLREVWESGPLTIHQTEP
jgi:hypothetical protein